MEEMALAKESAVIDHDKPKRPRCRWELNPSQRINIMLKNTVSVGKRVEVKNLPIRTKNPPVVDSQQMFVASQTTSHQPVPTKIVFDINAVPKATQHPCAAKAMIIIFYNKTFFNSDGGSR
ncbi:hypothetical protein JTB14_016824 [Gonioctena quinquepunctata]|nr:hypothetical protein JTB14_016824 [Gonioctena quinquepunctata]